MSTNVQDYVELLSAEQHVQIDKLREHARHGVSPRVRGEVWLYLLEVLSEDKTAEITSVITLLKRYQSLSSELPSALTSLVLKAALDHHTKRFDNPTYAGLITSITAAPTPVSSAVHSRDPSGRGGNTVNRTMSPIGSPPMGPQIASIGSVLPPPSNSSLSSHSSPSSLPKQHNVPPPFNLSGAYPSQNTRETDDHAEDTHMTLRPQSFLPPPPTKPPSRHAFLSILEEVLGKFWNSEKAEGRDDSWRRRVLGGGLEGSEKDWVYLCTPLVCCLSQPVAVFCAFQKLMERIYTFPPLPSRLATLLTLFRLALPELQSYFEDEQVPFYEVAVCWLKTLLSREMWLGDVLRLWDAYLAAEDMFALHCYVCVAILVTCKETLEELDGSEAKLMLLDLPPMDVDRLLQDAANLRVSFPLPRPVVDME